MKIAYFECATGISGDMTLAALIDAGVDEQAIRQGIDSLGLPGVQLHVSEVMQGSFRAKSIRVEHAEQHAHRHFSDIVRMIEAGNGLTPRQRQLSIDIFRTIAEAEARVHGSTIEQVHFHEVGALDSIVDIVGVAIGFDLLGVDRVICGPIPTGRGSIMIDHGVCAVPAPGTAELLKGIPLADVPIDTELTTPTGAAIVKTLADGFGSLPPMMIDRIGYGAGTKQFACRANILRLFVGNHSSSADTEDVCLLETNLDDVTGEIVGFTTRKLLSQGALDVFNVPVQMKKDRPGVMLCVLCVPEKCEAMETILYDETGTLGVRRQIIQRSVRPRKKQTVMTSLGPITGKVSCHSSGRSEFSPEFDDCAELAATNQIPFREVYRLAISAYDQSLNQT